MKNLKTKLNESFLTEAKKPKDKQDFTAMVLSVGNVSPATGKTMYDWGIYDNGWGKGMTAYLATGGFLIFDAQQSFEKGDTIALRGNDSNRLLKTTSIDDFCECTRDEVIAMCKNAGYDYTPVRAFKKRAGGNRKLTTSYSIKGVISNKVSESITEAKDDFDLWLEMSAKNFKKAVEFLKEDYPKLKYKLEDGIILNFNKADKSKVESFMELLDDSNIKYDTNI